jgi:sulfite exporter TauE/SafE
METRMFAGWIVALLTGAGLAGAASLHCLAMCGPLSAAAHARGGAQASVRYLSGRLAAYAVLGALAGSVGQSLLASRWSRWIEAALAWLLALVLLYAARGFLFAKPRGPRLLRIGAAPRTSWQSRLLARVAHDPLLLGVATALLPCGALFGALLASAALGSGMYGALAMLSFALLTSPALLGAAQLARLTRRGPYARRVFGSVLVAGALVTALRPIPGLRADAVPACHLHHGAAVAAQQEP